MKEFKDAEIGSQWELSGKRRAVVVTVDNESTLATKLLWVEHETEIFWFNNNGVQTANKRIKVVGPWIKKLKWEGQVKWEKHEYEDNYYQEWVDIIPTGDDMFVNLAPFVGKKTRMTLEEL